VHGGRLCLLSALLLAPALPVAGLGAPPLRAAILCDDIPGLDLALVARVEATLGATGVTVSRLSAEQLADPTTFRRETQDMLVLTSSPQFPGRARANVTRFLEAGGNLVLLGGGAYATPVCKVRGQWRDRQGFSELLASTPCETPLFTFDDGDTSAWQRSTNKPELPSRALTAPGVAGQCLRLDLRGLGPWQWDVFTAPLGQAVPVGQDLVCLCARGPEGTAQVSLEIDESDGSRWVTAVDLGREWRRYALEAGSFRLFGDGSPAGRGGAGDHLHLERAARLTFGLATGLTNHPDGDHVIEIDEVGTATNGLGATLADFSAPNTVCFDDYEPYVLRDAVRVTAAPGQGLVADPGVSEDAVEGLSAVGFTLWDRAELLPLLQAEDRYGRRRGWAASALVHYGGAYAGGCWLLSGVTTPGFCGSDAFARCLTGFVKAVAAGELVKQCADRNDARKAAVVPLVAPAPGGLTIAPDGQGFLGPDGRPFFMVGCDYIGSMDRKFMGGPWGQWLEGDFHRAHEAGLNCMRVYGASALYRDPAKLAALKECARRYGIYLLIVVVDHTDLQTRQELEARAREVATAFAGEPMLLGYDLQNEPYAYKLAEVRDGDQTLGARYPLWKRWGEYEQWAGLQTAGNFTSFPGVKGPLPRDDEWGPVLDATDGIFRDWIGWQVDAIRSVDPTHPISVGYNSVFDALPGNAQLDFVSHHAYQPPVDLEGVRLNLTTLDRLRAVWPDRPISLGEFGYTNGLKLADGYLDLHTSALGEFLHYLYAYAHGFAGCMKWTLTDHPLELSRQQCTWMPAEDLAAHIDQGRYGLFWSDGTSNDQPKPLVWALRFLRQYVEAGGERGDLQVTAAGTRIGTGYVFHAPRALFVGDVAYAGPGLEFTAAQAANVLLWWDEGRLRILSTADATARVDLAALLGRAPEGAVTVSGKLGSCHQAGGVLGLELLEGEPVDVAW
jgi:hypothetical protein